MVMSSERFDVWLEFIRIMIKLGLDDSEYYQNIVYGDANIKYRHVYVGRV